MRFVKIGAVLIILAVLIALIRTHGLRTVAGPMPEHSSPSQTELTLRLFINGTPASRLPDPQNDFVRRTIESKFHVKLDITYMEPGDPYNSTIASLLAANDPPDMWVDVSPDGGAAYAQDNVLADMTYFVTPKTMPNYFKYWINEKELKEYQTQNKFVRAPVPYDKQSYRSYYIRKDWLDRLGLGIPATYQDYYKVLKAFTEKDPDGDRINDTYGFTTSGNGSSLSLDWPEYVKNGLIYPAYFENDRLVDMQTDPKVGQVIDDILKVIDDGLVDPDWFLNKGQQDVDKAVQGRAGIILGDTADFAFDSNPQGIQARSRAITPAADWEPFNPFGDMPLRAAVTPGFPFVFSNNAAGLAPEKLKRITEILDCLAGEEGFLLTHYGIENKHYKRQGNTITLIPEQIDKDIVQNGNFLSIWDFFTPNAPQALGLTVIDPRWSARDHRIYDYITHIPVYEGLGTTLTPPIGISVEAMRAKQNEFQVKMLFSDKSSKHWPEYRNELMTQYNGEQIFKQYEEKIRAAREADKP